MSGSVGKRPEEKRYYLLPGQGRSNRRKRRLEFVAALIAGLIFSIALAALMYWVNSMH